MCKYDGRPMVGFPSTYKDQNLDNIASRVHAEKVNKLDINDAILFVSNR
jgi:hypothetical protein